MTSYGDSSDDMSTIAIRSADRVDAARKRILRVVHRHIVKINDNRGELPSSSNPEGDDKNMYEQEPEEVRSKSPNQNSNRSHRSSLTGLSPSDSRGTNSPQLEQLLPPTGSKGYTDASRTSATSPSSLGSPGVSRDLRDEEALLTGQSTKGSSNKIQESGTSGPPGNPTGQGIWQREIRTEDQLLRAAASSNSSDLHEESSSTMLTQCCNCCSWQTFMRHLLCLLALLILLLAFLLWWYAHRCTCGEPIVHPLGDCPSSEVNGNNGPLI